MSDGSASDSVLGGLHDLLDDLEALYKDIHSHPELSMQEKRTAGLAAERLTAAGFEVTDGVGGTGVVGLLRNGDGPTVMLRADMDALPVKEDTGLPYASTVTATDPDGNETPVMHACGHDIHVTWLAGASALLAGARDAWHGTLMAVFQPAEETAEGAQAMIDDGLFERFPKPDVVLGQHVMPMSAGIIASQAGVVTSAGDSFQIRMFGRGAHGSMPQASVDPVVMAASTVLRLQTIVSREVAPNGCRGGYGRRAASGNEGERDPRRGRDQAERPNVRRGRASARARGDRADRQGRGRRVGRAASRRRSPRSIAMTSCATTIRRRSGCATRCGLTSARRACIRYRAGVGQRGFRLLRSGMARPVGVLVHRRYRSRDVRHS